jgi:hypothetical protein
MGYRIPANDFSGEVVTVERFRSFKQDFDLDARAGTGSLIVELPALVAVVETVRFGLRGGGHPV